MRQFTLFLLAAVAVVVFSFSLQPAYAQVPNPGHSADGIGSGTIAGVLTIDGTNHRVGIGTANPLRNFVVQFSTPSTFANTAFYNPDTTNGNGVVLGFRTDTTGTGARTFVDIGGINTITTDHNDATRNTNLYFFTDSAATGSTDKMVITGAGNVGIGTMTPASTLDVSGIIRAQQICDENGASCKDVSAGWATDLWTLSGSDVYRSTGNVGIGTASPTQRLSVAGRVNIVGSSIFGDGVWGANTFEVHSSAWDGSSNNNYGGITGGHGYYYGGLQSGGNTGSEASAGQLYVAGTSMLMGNVGIGTATPAYRLTIAGTGAALAIDNQAAMTARNSAGTYETFLWPRWSDDIMYLNYGSSGFNIRNSGSTSTMFMTNGGNVGIGTASPGYKLQVAGDIYANGWLRTSGNTGWYSESYDGGWYMSDSTWIRSYGSKNIYQNAGILRTDGSLQVGPNGDRFIVTDAGNVGIGTTDPISRLSVGGAGVANAGVYGTGASYGVYGSAPTGVYGVGTGGGSTGVYGSGSGYGVFGFSADANGVYGQSTTGYGVRGVSGTTGVSGTGGTNGVYGTGYYGVWGEGSSVNAVGVYGNSNAGAGVVGNAISASGVYGNSQSSIGVYGKSYSSAGVQASGGLYDFYAESASGKSYFAGSVGIGTTSPQGGLKLAVVGNAGATQYCDSSGGNCFSRGVGIYQCPATPLASNYCANVQLTRNGVGPCIGQLALNPSGCFTVDANCAYTGSGTCTLIGYLVS